MPCVSHYELLQTAGRVLRKLSAPIDAKNIKLISNKNTEGRTSL